MIIMILRTSKSLFFCTITKNIHSVLDTNTISKTTFNCITCNRTKVWRCEHLVVRSRWSCFLRNPEKPAARTVSQAISLGISQFMGRTFPKTVWDPQFRRIWARNWQHYSSGRQESVGRNHQKYSRNTFLSVSSLDGWKPCSFCLWLSSRIAAPSL